MSFEQGRESLDTAGRPRSPRLSLDNDSPPVYDRANERTPAQAAEMRTNLNKVLQSGIGIETLLTRLKQSISSAKEFSIFLRERASLEERHANGMRKLTRNTADLIRRPDNRQGSFANNYEEVNRVHDRMAENALEFMHAVNIMADELSGLADQTERGRKQWKHIGLEAESRAREAEMAMEKARSKYISSAEQYDRTRTGERQSSGKFGLKGSRSAAQQEEAMLGKVDMADADYQSRVELARSSRRELLNSHRPQAINELQNLILVCDAGVSAQLQKYAMLNEKLLFGNGVCVTPLKNQSSTTGPRSLREIAHSIDNQKDFEDYILLHSNRVGPTPPEIKYEKHPALMSSTQNASPNFGQSQSQFHTPERRDTNMSSMSGMGGVSDPMHSTGQRSGIVSSITPDRDASYVPGHAPRASTNAPQLPQIGGLGGRTSFDSPTRTGGLGGRSDSEFSSYPGSQQHRTGQPPYSPIDQPRSPSANEQVTMGQSPIVAGRGQTLPGKGGALGLNSSQPTYPASTASLSQPSYPSNTGALSGSSFGQNSGGPSQSSFPPTTGGLGHTGGTSHMGSLGHSSRPSDTGDLPPSTFSQLSGGLSNVGGLSNTGSPGHTGGLGHSSHPSTTGGLSKSSFSPTTGSQSSTGVLGSGGQGFNTTGPAHSSFSSNTSLPASAGYGAGKTVGPPSSLSSPGNTGSETTGYGANPISGSYNPMFPPSSGRPGSSGYGSNTTASPSRTGLGSNTSNLGSLGQGSNMTGGLGPAGHGLNRGDPTTSGYGSNMNDTSRSGYPANTGSMPQSSFSSTSGGLSQSGYPSNVGGPSQSSYTPTTSDSVSAGYGSNVGGATRPGYPSASNAPSTSSLPQYGRGQPASTASIPQLPSQGRGYDSSAGGRGYDSNVNDRGLPSQNGGYRAPGSTGLGSGVINNNNNNNMGMSPTTSKNNAPMGAAGRGPSLPPTRPVFGLSLDELFQRDQSAVPAIVDQCVQAVDLFGLNTEGIYRTSGSVQHITELRAQFDHDSAQVDFRDTSAFFNDIASVTTLLKQFLRDLRDPLLTSVQYNSFIQAAKIDDDVMRRDSLHAIINSLPDPNYATLRTIVLHLNRVAAHSMKNRMTTNNLAIIFGPTLMAGHVNGPGGDVKDASWQAIVVETVLNHALEIFDDDY